MQITGIPEKEIEFWFCLSVPKRDINLYNCKQRLYVCKDVAATGQDV